MNGCMNGSCFSYNIQYMPVDTVDIGRCYGGSLEKLRLNLIEFRTGTNMSGKKRDSIHSMGHAC